MESLSCSFPSAPIAFSCATQREHLQLVGRGWRAGEGAAVIKRQPKTQNPGGCRNAGGQSMLMSVIIYFMARHPSSLISNP